MDDGLRDMKAHKDYYNMLHFVADAQQGIPKLCPCGSITKEVVDEKDTYDYLPGKRYFICKDYENDGMHFRQPWVMGMQQEVEKLKMKVYEQEKLLRECQALKEQVRMLQMRVTELEGVLPSQCSDECTVKERRKWSPKEDIILIGAWLNTSKDPIINNEQKVGRFWKRIVECYNSSPLLIGTVPRELGQCKQRWSRINEMVCKFCGCYEAALRGQRSGQNDNDVMKAALDIFYNDKGIKFNLEHAWRELRHDVKWSSSYLEKDKRNTVDFEAQGSKPLERPIGVKEAKAARKRKKFGKAEELAELKEMVATKKEISNQALLASFLSKTEPMSDMEKL